MDTKKATESQSEDVEMASKAESSTNLPPGLATLTSAEAIRVEKKVVSKQDMVMMPLLAGCTFFVFLVRVSNTTFICIARLTCDKDRAALGNARLMQFPQDLHLTNQQFYNCLMIICTWSTSVRTTLLTFADVGYMSFELPATLSIRVWHPNFVYGGAVVFFGLCALLTSQARSYASVMVLRLFLGFGESFIQTGFVYLSLWYSNRELTTRCGMWATILQ